MTYTKKVALNTAVQAIGRFVSTGTSLILVILLTNYLGTSGYGEYTTIFAFVGFFNVFVDLGLYMITVREISKKGANIEEIVGNLLSIRIILALSVFSVASALAFLMPYSMTVKFGIILASLAIGLVTIGQTFNSIFQSKLKMYFAVMSEISGRLIVLGVTVYMIMTGRTLLEVVMAYVAGDIIQLTLQYLFSRRFVKIRPRFDRQVIKRLIIFALPLGLASVLGMINFKIDSLLLSVLPLQNGLSNMHEVGIYGVPYKILEILIAFPSMFVGSVFPLLSEYINTDKEKAHHIFRKASSFMVLMAIPLVVGTLIMADEIILLISGPEFIASASVLRILIFSVAITFLSSLFSHTIISANLQKKLIFVMLCVSSFNVLANLIFIPKYSYFAAATVTVLSEMILLFLTLFIIIRYVKFKPAFSVFLRAFLASILMGGVVFIARNQLIGIFSQGKLMQALGILMILALGCLVYFPTAYLVKAISKEDIRKLMAR